MKDESIPLAKASAPSYRRLLLPLVLLNVLLFFLNGRSVQSMQGGGAVATLVSVVRTAGGWTSHWRQGVALGTGQGNDDEATPLKRSNRDSVQAAKDIQSKSDRPFIIVMQASIGMVQMVKSWLCNTVTMEGVHENTLIIFDEIGFESMQGFATKATIVHDSLPPELQGSWKYKTLGYWRTTQNRVHTIGSILKANVSMLLVEPDATWLENVYEDPDLVGGEDEEDFIAISDDLSGVGFGFLRIKANSTEVFDIWDVVKANVDRELGPVVKGEDLTEILTVKGEQKYFNMELKRRQRLGSVRFKLLSQWRFPSGRWYDGGMGGDGEAYRAESRNNEPRGVAVIQQNWMVGTECKMIRAKRWDHWFLDAGPYVCFKDPSEALEKARASVRDGIPPHGPPTPEEDEGKCDAQQNAPTDRRALARHYLKVYRAMIISKEIPSKFVLLRFNSTSLGLGNKIRSLNGAMFLAAVTDRVLLVDSPVLTKLFQPPIVDGIVLDWNASLALGACDESDAVRMKVRWKDQKGSADVFTNFQQKYDDVSCLVASQPYGHDRQFAISNQDVYKNKMLQIFGDSTSRYNWSLEILGLLLQRPSPAFLQVGISAMKRLGLDSVPPTHRIALQLRTFTNDVDRWKQDILSHAPEILECTERLVRDRLLHLQRTYSNASTASILLISDSEELKEEIKKRLQGIEGLQIVQSAFPVIHTGRVQQYESGWMNAFLDWFLMGECQSVIATGYSSFGLTAFFRPSLLPSTSGTRSKDLFTIDRLMGGKLYGNMQNKHCGKVEPEGYFDINFGMTDSKMKTVRGPLLADWLDATRSPGSGPKLGGRGKVGAKLWHAPQGVVQLTVGGSASKQKTKIMHAS